MWAVAHATFFSCGRIRCSHADPQTRQAFSQLSCLPAHLSGYQPPLSMRRQPLPSFSLSKSPTSSIIPTSQPSQRPACLPAVSLHSPCTALGAIFPTVLLYCVTLLPHAIAVFRQYCQTQHCCPISLWHGRYTSHAPCQAGAACSMTIFTLAVASCRVLVHTSLFTHSLTASYPWGTHWVSQSEQDTRATSSGTHLLPHSVISPRLCI